MLVYQSFLNSLADVFFGCIVTELTVNVVTYFSVRYRNNLIISHCFTTFRYIYSKWA